MSERRVKNIELSITTEASPEQVWKAVATAEGLQGWFAPQAKVEPGEGGSIWVSFGEGMEGSTQIVSWEPGVLLKLHDPPREEKDGEPVRLMQEYSIRTEKGKTVLRFVHSGFVEEQWDNEYESMKRGWVQFFIVLEEMLRHPETARRDQMGYLLIAKKTAEEAWAKLTGPDGIDHGDGIVGIAEGERFSWQTPAGLPMEGEMLVHQPPLDLVARLANWQDAILRISLERMEQGSMVNLMLHSFDGDAGRLEELGAEWKAILDRLFPDASYFG
ncbi:SRPBCC domain-containing protein [bacterium]|nr:SRPBCC domain-containing protein [bacterium]